MKIVLSGSTGYIGNGVLTHALQHPAVTSLVLLARRAPENLPQSDKIKLLIIKDFTSYDEATIKELETADAAIWCIGTYNGDQQVDIEYPLHFINTIKNRSSGSVEPFRFVKLGGAFTEAPRKEGEKDRFLWFYPTARRVMGVAAEKVMAESSENGSRGNLTTYLVKPAVIFPKDGGILRKIVPGNSLVIGMDELGVTMVDLAVNGSQQKVFLNKDIIDHGKKLLTESA